MFTEVECNNMQQQCICTVYWHYRGIHNIVRSSMLLTSLRSSARFQCPCVEMAPSVQTAQRTFQHTTGLHLVRHQRLTPQHCRDAPTALSISADANIGGNSRPH